MMKQMVGVFVLVVGLVALHGSALADICNGGSTAVTINETVVTLSCPTSGGPSCKAAEACVCTAQANDMGGYDGINKCKKPEKAAAEIFPY